MSIRKSSSTENPHRRYNPLMGEWVLISPHRTQRPWQGQVEKLSKEMRPHYDSSCYLCPGNTRAGGIKNPDYQTTFVFTNDFSALLPEIPTNVEPRDFLLQIQPVKGTCRVICFSPRHDLTLPEMQLDEIRQVVDLWAEQVLDLGANYRWVQIFENKGTMMGSSNPHPHGQIWASDFLPNVPEKEDQNQKSYYKTHNRPLLLDYARIENQADVRTIVLNEDWLAVVPYWAVWPFETLLLPRRHVLRLPDLSNDERNSLASILKRLLTKYDNLFQTSFPYSMGWHGAPTGPDLEIPQPHWQLHAHFYPPLLRSAVVRKFMVGYEMMAEPQRDLTAEQAAKRLKSVLETHYLEASSRNTIE